MGQAKNRGSHQERVQQATERKDDFYGEEISIDEVRKQLNLSNEYQFSGYVIHLPEKDEFVGMITDNDMLFGVGYVRTPDVAKVYDDVQIAISDAKKITKHKLLVCARYSTDKHDVINDVWANY